MEEIFDVIVTVASAASAVLFLLGLVFAVYRWILKQNKQDKDIRCIKEEQTVLTAGVLACLKGLKEQGCDGPVTEAIQIIEIHLNKEAHK